MEHESTWVYAIEENELKENSANMVFPKGLPVLLIKKAGEIYAISNKCAHMACMVDFLLEQEVILEQKHGIPYCPCQGLTKKREENMKIVCPCIPFHREHFDAIRRCWCLLFVTKDVTNPNELKQIPFNELKRGQDVR